MPEIHIFRVPYATHCNTLQHSGNYIHSHEGPMYSYACLGYTYFVCLTQHTATQWKLHTLSREPYILIRMPEIHICHVPDVTHCNTNVPHATHCKTLQNTATRCNTKDFVWNLFHVRNKKKTIYGKRHIDEKRKRNTYMYVYAAGPHILAKLLTSYKQTYTHAHTVSYTHTHTHAHIHAA